MMTRPTAPETLPPSTAHVATDNPAVPPDSRMRTLVRWLEQRRIGPRLRLDSMRPASNDASFRRYFRLDCEPTPGEVSPAATLVVMDAPPQQEDCRPFVHVASLLRQAGLRAPAILEADLEQGFLLIEDMGERTLLDRLAEQPGATEVEALYRAAGDALVTMQSAAGVDDLPRYDRDLLEHELQLFPDWYLSRHLGRAPDAKVQAMLRKAFDALIDNALGQAQVFVHRDYHSRNLMIDARALQYGPGIIDFQDAVLGPITYDLVSLLRDAYVRWPEDIQIDRAVRWWEAARRADLPVPADFGTFWRDFEWIGLQRHLKVLGIFARLWHRDGKDRYLADLPLVMEGALMVARRYDAFAGLARLLESAPPSSAARGRSDRSPRCEA